jgi:folate-dependent phosphoribosylglycinamide formyltransferase PurN
MTSPLPIVVLISGGGSTLENLIFHQKEKGLAIEFRAVISSRSTVRGIQIARDAGIPTARRTLGTQSSIEMRCLIWSAVAVPRLWSWEDTWSIF